MENQFQRHQDIAESILISAQCGTWEAWQYLIRLCKEAEAGKYAAQHRVHTDPPSALPVVDVSQDGRVSVHWDAANSAGG